MRRGALTLVTIRWIEEVLGDGVMHVGSELGQKELGQRVMRRVMFEQQNRPAYRRFVPHRRISAQLAASRWVWRLAQLGYAAKGLLYVIIGGTTALAAVNVGGRVVGTRGALDLLVGRPFWRLVVALVAVGLVGFILRRF